MIWHPTQKPAALRERLLDASSNPGDVVLPPFCGRGTTVHSAQKLGRQWIGIDVTLIAIGLIETRLRKAFPGIEDEVHGNPMDAEAVRAFFNRNDPTKNEFEIRAVGRLGFVPPTKPMVDRAGSAGMCEVPGFAPLNRLQIVSIEQALALRERSVEKPARRDDTFRRPAREVDKGAQDALDL